MKTPLIKRLIKYFKDSEKFQSINNFYILLNFNSFILFHKSQLIKNYFHFFI